MSQSPVGATADFHILGTNPTTSSLVSVAIPRRVHCRFPRHRKKMSRAVTLMMSQSPVGVHCRFPRLFFFALGVCSVSQSPAGSTADFHRKNFSVVEKDKTAVSQSPAGSTADFHLPNTFKPFERCPRNCRNPPKGPLPISTTFFGHSSDVGDVRYVAIPRRVHCRFPRARKIAQVNAPEGLSQSPAGSTADFHHVADISSFSQTRPYVAIPRRAHCRFPPEDNIFKL